MISVMCFDPNPLAISGLIQGVEMLNYYDLFLFSLGSIQSVVHARV